MTDEDMFVMKMDKVITMTECKDQKLIGVYKQYYNEEEENEGTVFPRADGDAYIQTGIYLLASKHARRDLEEHLKKILKILNISFQTLQRLLYRLEGLVTHLVTSVKLK